jgi:hypothetical protein
MKLTVSYPGYGRKPRYYIDGVEVSQEEHDAVAPKHDITKGVPGGHAPSCWPMWSDNAGVNPDQVREATEACRAHGVPTEFCKETGQVKWEDAAHRKRYCELPGLNYYDRNGGYSDPQRR